MRRIAVVVFVLVFFSSPAFSQGGIYLFADSTSYGISSDIEDQAMKDIYIAYSSNNGQGPDGICGVEFRVFWEADYLITTGAATLYPHIVVDHMGDIRNGIAIVFNRCHGVGRDYLFFGHFTVMALEDIVSGSDPVILSVITSPTSFEQEPIVADCGVYHAVHVVTGHKFVFPHEAFVIATEPSTWGAIKALSK